MAELSAKGAIPTSCLAGSHFAKPGSGRKAQYTEQVKKLRAGDTHQKQEVELSPKV